MTTRPISSLQYKAIAALLSERTYAEAAKQAGCSREAIDKWMAKPEFRAALAEAQRELWRSAIRALSRRCGRAIDTLGEIADDTSAPHAARVSAAKSVADLTLKVRDADFEERLEQLERAAGLR